MHAIRTEDLRSSRSEPSGETVQLRKGELMEVSEITLCQLRVKAQKLMDMCQNIRIPQVQACAELDWVDILSRSDESWALANEVHRKLDETLEVMIRDGGGSETAELEHSGFGVGDLVRHRASGTCAVVTRVCKSCAVHSPLRGCGTLIGFSKDALADCDFQPTGRYDLSLDADQDDLQGVDGRCYALVERKAAP